MTGLQAVSGAAIAWNIVTAAGGTVGAILAYHAGLPLPFLLGSLIAVAVISAAAPVRIAPRFRNTMVAVLGVLLGSAFTPQFVETAASNAVAFLFLVPFTLGATAIVFTILRRTTSLDQTTAYFSAVPGGVNEMTMLGAERGGDEAALAVHHSIRVILVIVVVSLIFAALYGRGATVGVLPKAESLDLRDYGLIALIGAGGVVLGRMARTPAPFILGPLAVSAVVHVVGWTDVKPDFLLVSAAQIVAGSALGTQFRRFSRRDLVSAGMNAVKIATLLIVLTVAFAYAMTFVVDRPFGVLLITYAPGGLGEMGLIALSVGADAAFVSTGQVVRFFLVVSFAAFFHRPYASLLGGALRHKAGL
ncbi:AbrB family transcriptional regulator [Mongoliimonas terrestris]|uniref:AbrB family transcriptional regulator n=1 Tax=Mongoliimonas terrestris TaxID=1709001 RepID=UPI0009497447|nr:AbrB family transcriptional regulator [Mongoliimonas terrestris]